MAASGHGLSVAVLGGFRTVVADLTWLRAYAMWERRDAPSTEALLKLTTTLDPRPAYFWLNGARMIAYDIPAWLSADVRSPAEQTVIETAHAKRALDYLEQGLTFLPADAAMWVERGNIQMHRLHDLEAAAESYRHAAQLPDAPFYAARIHAELLRRCGRKAEALAWLVALYPTLPVADETAGAAIVLARIHELERELQMAAELHEQAALLTPTAMGL